MKPRARSSRASPRAGARGGSRGKGLVPAAVIFDMDGVMVDSEHQWKLAEAGFFRAILDRWDEADHAKIVGLSVPDLYAFLAREYGLRQTYAEFFAMCERLGEDIYGKRVALSAGLIELLDELKTSGRRIGLASSSPKIWIERVLARFRLGRYIEHAVSVDDVGGQSKPSPAVYLEAAKRLGVEPRHCLAIEDSVYGVSAAKQAGMFCVGYRSGLNDEQDLSRADAEVRSFRELLGGGLQALAAGKMG